MNGHFSEGDISMAHRCMKRCSGSLVVRETRVQTTLCCHLTPDRQDSLQESALESPERTCHSVCLTALLLLAGTSDPLSSQKGCRGVTEHRDTSLKLLKCERPCGLGSPLLTSSETAEGRTEGRRGLDRRDEEPLW